MMKENRTLLWALIALVSMALTVSAQVSYVVVISVDGLGGTYMSNLFARVDNTYPIPNFKRLRNEGASTLAAHIDNNNYETLPNHTSIVTARPQLGVNGHAWVSNATPHTTIHLNKGSYVASVFDVAHDNGLRTAMYANKTKFSLFDGYGSYTQGASYNALNGAVDVIGVDNGRDKIDTTLLSTNLGGLIVDTYVAEQKTANPIHYAFLHINEPDSYGHSTGWGSATWYSQVTVVDGMVGKIFKLIEQDVPAMKDHTAIILTADHGTQSTYVKTADRYSVPFFVWGPGVPAGADLYALNAGRRQVASIYPMTTYTGLQPIRNAEANNVALQLLGLGPIPGSTFDYAQDLKVTLPPAPAISGITHDGHGTFTISGTVDRLGQVILWKATNLAAPNWLPVQTNAVASAGSVVFTVPQGANSLALFKMEGR
jgi:hypothetical protein